MLIGLGRSSETKCFRLIYLTICNRRCSAALQSRTPPVRTFEATPRLLRMN